VGVATVVLVAVTAYYSWTTRALVRETHGALQAAARSTLQERLDRISEICIRFPDVYPSLEDPDATGDEQDARFHIANMFLSLLEEAHTQYRIDGSMDAQDWTAWVATADVFLPKPYIVRYWRRVSQTYEPSFRGFVDERLRVVQAAA
jgi:hypothetical protein